MEKATTASTHDILEDNTKQASQGRRKRLRRRRTYTKWDSAEDLTISSLSCSTHTYSLQFIKVARVCVIPKEKSVKKLLF